MRERRPPDVGVQFGCPQAGRHVLRRAPTARDAGQEPVPHDPGQAVPHGLVAVSCYPGHREERSGVERAVGADRRQHEHAGRQHAALACSRTARRVPHMAHHSNDRLQNAAFGATLIVMVTTSAVTLDPEHALPNAFYRDPVVHAAEMDGIWHGDWVFVTTEDAVSARGDQLPVIVGDQPVLLLRNQQGELRALSNLCAHRGTLLVERPAKAKRIQCPYHAWTYNDSGRLLAAPFTSKDEVDKAEHCLPEYRVESWHGLIFVSLRPEVERVAERFAAVDPHVIDRGIDELHHYSDYQETQQWDCNWKLAIVNAMESYHLFQVHPKT
ncbi:MAG: Rieske 2Fe-2S domain-containing protein, partial [Acidimicrobiaceae bacterium]|nr:Rieske 2Fe-2S domain-containing protein [Acidimicrobiaceae bacterium]